MNKTERDVAEELVRLDLQLIIHRAASLRGWSRKELARRSGLSKRQVKKFFKDGAKPSIRVIGCIFKAIGIELKYDKIVPPVCNPEVQKSIEAICGTGPVQSGAEIFSNRKPKVEVHGGR